MGHIPVGIKVSARQRPTTRTWSQVGLSHFAKMKTPSEDAPAMHIFPASRGLYHFVLFHLGDLSIRLQAGSTGFQG